MSSRHTRLGDMLKWSVTPRDGSIVSGGTGDMEDATKVVEDHLASFSGSNCFR